jgi:hypothetical protein
MDKRIDIEELTELLNIPEFERIVYHKVEELKCVMSDRIDYYINLKNNFKKTAYGNLQIFENESFEGRRVYRFELSKSEEGRWIPTVVEPDLPAGCNVYDVIPPAVIKFVACFKTESNRIRKHKGSFQTTTGKRQFSIEFTKYSDFHILGTIMESTEEFVAVSRDRQNVVKLDFPSQKSDTGNNFEELMHYMQTRPKIGEQMLNYFNYIIKPVEDGGNAKADSG